MPTVSQNLLTAKIKGIMEKVHAKNTTVKNKDTLSFPIARHYQYPRRDIIVQL